MGRRAINGSGRARGRLLDATNDGPEPVLQDSYDWDAIRSHARELVFVNSVTDEFGCDAEQGRAMFDRLGGTLVVRDDGHFVSETMELVDRLIP